MQKNHLFIVLFFLFGFSCNSATNNEDKPKTDIPEETLTEDKIEAFEDDRIVCYSFPEDEKLNSRYRVYVNDHQLPVYNAKVGMEDKVEREKAMDDPDNAHLYYDIAGFAYFDLKKGPAKIKVSVDKNITRAKILPTSANIVPVIDGRTLSFDVSSPQHLTVEINGEHIRSLHVFVNPEETDVPDPDDPDVIYFGPGVHRLDERLFLTGNNKTVYVAGGAVVRCYEPASGDRSPSIHFVGLNMTLKGRGIIDQENISNSNSKKRGLTHFTGDNMHAEGVILRNSSGWHLTLRGATNVHVDNVKIMGHRSTSDGIDICDAWDVLVENCFIRTLDDLIVVKTNSDANGCGRIVARKCVLWNEVAHALNIGAEIRKPVDDVLFTDCDVIGDHSREWTLRIYHCDNTLVSNIRFENIRIEETVRLASLWIGEEIYSITPGSDRGHIRDVVFKDITVTNASGTMTDKFNFTGYDAGHAINHVLMQNVTLEGRKVTANDVVKNNYVYDLKIE
jgi:hypothetical protein